MIGDESFAYVSEGVFSFASSAAQVLSENIISCEQAEDALEVLGVATVMGMNDGKNLRGREWNVGTILPDGVGDVELEDCNEGHWDTHHMG